MRMWMLDPRVLCRLHLLGEHGELHKHRSSFVKQRSIAGRRGQIEPLAMKSRHDDLAEEMLRRRYRHESPYELPDLSYLSELDRGMKVDLVESRADLMGRCSDCATRILDLERTSII